MNQMLTMGQSVHTDSSKLSCKVKQFIGSGTQGEVYEAELEGKLLALKWYFPQWATAEQRTILETLIAKGSPHETFLWPITLVSAPHSKGFGYLMPLREKRFKNISDLMKRRIDPSFRALATAGFQLSHSFLKLHAQGLCYRDISHTNVFFDPATGDILICDNDNVAVDGSPLCNIAGTPRFMAPEIVRGEALPSIQTELLSLADLLFYILLNHHPLEGKKEAEIRSFDLPAMTKIYGTEPVFIFDPNNDSNRPLPGYHDNALIFWPIYPQFLRNLFTRAFTEGIHDPQHGRVRESEWRAAMVKLRDSIIYCGKCGRENFYDVDALRTSPNHTFSCWSCKRKITLTPRIRIGEHIVMLNYDTKLYPHHIDDQRLYDFTQPVAAIAQHPKDPNTWGLKNLSKEKWVTTGSNGSIKDVEPERSVTLVSGVKINFGKVEGEIRF